MAFSVAREIVSQNLLSIQRQKTGVLDEVTTQKHFGTKRTELFVFYIFEI